MRPGLSSVSIKLALSALAATFAMVFVLSLASRWHYLAGKQIELGEVATVIAAAAMVSLFALPLPALVVVPVALLVVRGAQNLFDRLSMAPTARSLIIVSASVALALTLAWVDAGFLSRGDWGVWALAGLCAGLVFVSTGGLARAPVTPASNA
jgi:hypothetical protein